MNDIEMKFDLEAKNALEHINAAFSAIREAIHSLELIKSATTTGRAGSLDHWDGRPSEDCEIFVKTHGNNIRIRLANEAEIALRIVLSILADAKKAVDAALHVGKKYDLNPFDKETVGGSEYTVGC